MQNLKIGIVEDDFLIAESLVETLTQIGYDTTEPVRTFDDALQMIETQSPDLVLLDIEIHGEKTGIDVGIHIHENYQLPFIFLTAFSDSATIDKAKKANPYAYLVKPFSEGDLYATIEVALTNFNAQKRHKTTQPIDSNKTIFIKNGDLFEKVETEKILYIECENVYLNIYTSTDKRFVIRAKIEEFLNELSNSNFIQIHRSYAVNWQHIEGIDASNVIINKQSLPIGKSYKDELLGRVKFLK